MATAAAAATMLLSLLDMPILRGLEFDLKYSRSPTEGEAFNS